MKQEPRSGRWPPSASRPGFCIDRNPFDILDETRGPTCVTVNSGHWRHLDPPATYPDEVLFPVDQHLQYVYFLHTAGYIEDEQCLGRYSFVYQDGRMAQIDLPLIPLYRLDKRPHDWAAQANIQDWWEGYPQFANDRSACFPMPQYENAMTVYLYVTEWVNPRADKPIREIRFCSDPTAWGAVLLLGITGLRHSTDTTDP